MKFLMSAVEEEAQQSFNVGKILFLTALMLLSEGEKQRKKAVEQEVDFMAGFLWSFRGDIGED